MKYFILIVILLSVINGYTQHIEKTILYYETNQWQLTLKHKHILDSLYNDLSNKQIKNISINGHTDNIGDSLYNIKLSKKRSNSVADYVILKLDNQKIIISYFGEKNSVTDNSDSKNRTLNRRVEIIFNLTDKNNTEAYIKDLEEFYKLISPAPQEFCIRNDRDTVLIGTEGTFIYIKANTFLDPLNPDDCIKIGLKERYKKSQIILDNLSTITMDHKMLVSQAMFELDFDRPLNKTNGIIIFTPADTILPEILPFQGVRDDKDNMHWCQISEEVINIQGVTINDYLDEICFENSIVYDTLETKCHLFFCKIFDRLGIKKFEPLVSYRIFKDTVSCPIPSDIQAIHLLADTLTLEKLKDIPIDSLKYYVFNATRLGWYNLDWLLKYDESIDYKVFAEPENNFEMKLVFKEFRSVIPLIPEKDYYHLPDAPLNSEAWLLAFKIQEGKILLAIKEVTIDSIGINNLKLEEVTIEELHNKLKVFD